MKIPPFEEIQRLERRQRGVAKPHTRKVVADRRAAAGVGVDAFHPGANGSGITESVPRLAFGVVARHPARHPARHQFLDAPLEVKRELGVDVGAGARGGAWQPDESLHDPPSEARRSEAALT